MKKKKKRKKMTTRLAASFVFRVNLLDEHVPVFMSHKPTS